MYNRSRSAAVYILFFAGLALLLSLGGWQWRRGVEKAAIETQLERSGNQYITIERSPPDWTGLAYRQVQLQGAWLAAPVFLLANRTHRGRVGYEVLSPFQLAGDASTLLVNRGWVDAETAERGAPAWRAGLDAGPDAGVSGRLYLPRKGVTLGPAHTPAPGAPPGLPRVIQYFDAAQLSEVFGGVLQPAAVALDAAHPGAFARIWRAYAMNATRHFGYAVQWWGLAATLLVFGVIWRRQSARRHRR